MRCATKSTSLFFETIKVENFEAFNIEFHQKRFEKTIKDNFNIETKISLKELIKPPLNRLYRCKIVYNQKIVNIEYSEYLQREFKSFKLIDSDIKYNYKFLDRESIDYLFSKRELSDDIIIINRGFLKDTSIANIALLIDNIWYTPKNPLLKGTLRAKLLKEQKIFEKELRVEDLKKADKFAILNAMVGFLEISHLSTFKT